MSFVKKAKVKRKDLNVGCLTCSTAALIADMDMIICVGFGASYVKKDGKIIYDGERTENPKTVQFFEDLAQKDPDHDWRIVKIGPMHGETFQRQGEKNWVCVESNEGFA